MQDLGPVILGLTLRASRLEAKHPNLAQATGDLPNEVKGKARETGAMPEEVESSSRQKLIRQDHPSASDPIQSTQSADAGRRYPLRHREKRKIQD